MVSDSADICIDCGKLISSSRQTKYRGAHRCEECAADAAHELRIDQAFLLMQTARTREERRTYLHRMRRLIGERRPEAVARMERALGLL